MRGVCSDPIEVSSGVPQGSHLGPILFLIFINDLVLGLRFVRALLYADDLKVFAVVRCLRDASLFQIDLDFLSQWSWTNEIGFNLGKCKLLTFSRHRSPLHFEYSLCGSILERVASIRDLGVIFSSDFSFSSHIDSVVSRSFRLLGFIKRASTKFKASTTLYLFRVLVLPIVTFCSVVWSPYTLFEQEKLESLQHNLLRFLAFKKGMPMAVYDHDYSSISEVFFVHSIVSVHRYFDLVYAFKVVNGLLCSPDLLACFQRREVDYPLRVFREFHERQSRSNSHFHSAGSRLVRLWNELPVDARECVELRIFKLIARDWALEFYDC